jgi:phenylpyruvate tautomerase PptA (4-oxalocrotonate tautomerase family)
MPHLTVHALEEELAGQEAPLAEALTAAVVSVYGEWARELVGVQMIGVQQGRWAIGGNLVRTVSPAVTFGVREAMFARPDARELVPKLVASLTDAVASVFGEHCRAGVTVELVATALGRSGIGGVLV